MKTIKNLTIKPLLVTVTCLTLAACVVDETTQPGSSSSSSSSGGVPPVFTSSHTVAVPENTTGAVYSAASTAVSVVSYAITGEEAKLFIIDATTGAMAFIAPPDYENTKDADLNNKYEVTVNAMAGGLTSALPVTITVTTVATPSLAFIFPTAGAELGLNSVQFEFTAQLRFEETESHTPLAVTDVAVTNQLGDIYDIEQPGYVNGTNGLWIKKGIADQGSNTLTATATYSGQIYTATQTLQNTSAIKAEAFGLNITNSTFTIFNGLYPALDTLSFTNKTIREQVLPADVQLWPRLTEFESESSKPWAYTLSKTNISHQMFVVRANKDFSILTYVRVQQGVPNAEDFVKGVTSMVLDENEDALPANDRLLVLQHDNGTAWVSSLNVGDKLLTDNNGPMPEDPQGPNPSLSGSPLYTTVWTQPAGISNADQIAFDSATQTLVILDKKTTSSDLIFYTLNRASNSYDHEKFRVSLGTNNARLVTGNGKVYVSEGSSTPWDGLTINSIDAATGLKTLVYSQCSAPLFCIDTGPTFASITDMRMDHLSGTLYVLDGVANRFISINLATKARTLVKSFAVASGLGIAPNDIAFDGYANYFITDNNTGAIVGVDATSGQRRLVRSGLTDHSQQSVAQQIRYNETNGLITVESLLDTAGMVTGKTLAKTDVRSGAASLLTDYNPTFTVDHLGIFQDAQLGNFAVSIDGNRITITNLANGEAVTYSPPNNFGFTPPRAVEINNHPKSTLCRYANKPLL